MPIYIDSKFYVKEVKGVIMFTLHRICLAVSGGTIKENP
ncbi:hypothetical protein IC006_1542 [Sulfuracidifex tepidarius]|uniref:Uncharacterized protein n=1 Tax=Sulfuracidifex tepidarius TaxID=1294262 RepID=A0A510DVN4_9CREN|nr:hypothetical protein IC006_1542 [Sulfuracidifex tepidarius]BBG26991.1 hypothetical protein IC007_1519 [Sulfuracidifex tepidarius]